MNTTDTTKEPSAREGFEAQRRAGINVDWFTWQIAWHDAMFKLQDCAATTPQTDGATYPEPVSQNVIDHCWKMYREGQIAVEAKESFGETLQSFAKWLLNQGDAHHEPSWQEGYIEGYDDSETVASNGKADGVTVVLTDERISEIIEDFDGGSWIDGEYRIDCKDMMKLARTLLAATHAPAMAETQTDAARYRWLRSEHFPTADNPPLAQVVWKAFDNRHSSDWANMVDGNDLDRAIDAAIAAASGGEQGS
jgi:hypothetical protein